jgi:hypothetical protein
MAKKIDDIDNYIKTFKLKSFDESDEEDNIFSTKDPIQNINSNIPTGNEIKIKLTYNSPNKNEKEFANKDFILNNFPSSITEVIKAQDNKVFQSDSLLTEYKIDEKNKNDKSNVIIGLGNSDNHKYENTTKLIDKEFKNISNNYQKLICSKVKVLSDEKELIEYELIKCEKENFPNRNNDNKKNNLINTKIKAQNKTSSIQMNFDDIDNEIDVMHHSVKAQKDIAEKQESTNLNDDKFSLSHQNTNNFNLFNKNQLKEQNVKIRFNKNNLVLINSSSNKIFLTKNLFNDNSLDNIILKDYFPISYSSSKNEFQKMFKNLFQNIKNGFESKIIKTSLEEYILFYVMNSYLENNFKCYLIDKTSNNSTSIRKTLINSLKSLKLINFTNDNLISQKKIKLTNEIEPVDSGISNIIRHGIDKLLVQCYNEKSGSNLLFFSLFGNKEDIFMYISTIFEENPHFKEDDFYLLFMIKSGSIKKLVSEKSDYIFNNFSKIFVMLIQNYEYFESNCINSFMKFLRETDSSKVIFINLENFNYHINFKFNFK